MTDGPFEPVRIMSVRLVFSLVSSLAIASLFTVVPEVCLPMVAPRVFMPMARPMALELAG